MYLYCTQGQFLCDFQSVSLALATQFLYISINRYTPNHIQTIIATFGIMTDYSQTMPPQLPPESFTLINSLAPGRSA